MQRVIPTRADEDLGYAPSTTRACHQSATQCCVRHASVRTPVISIKFWYFWMEHMRQDLHQCSVHSKKSLLQILGTVLVINQAKSVKPVLLRT